MFVRDVKNLSGSWGNLNGFVLHARTNQHRLIGNTCFAAKLKKRTYTYESLQFPFEMNTRGSKTPTTFIHFHTKYDSQVHSFD